MGEVNVFLKIEDFDKTLPDHIAVSDMFRLNLKTSTKIKFSESEAYCVSCTIVVGVESKTPSKVRLEWQTETHVTHLNLGKSVEAGIAQGHSKTFAFLKDSHPEKGIEIIVSSLNNVGVHVKLPDLHDYNEQYIIGKGEVISIPPPIELNRNYYIEISPVDESLHLQILVKESD